MTPLILYPAIGAASSFGLTAAVNKLNEKEFPKGLATVAGAIVGLALTTFSLLQVTAFVSVGAFLAFAKAKRRAQTGDFDVPLFIAASATLACAGIAAFGAWNFTIGAVVCLGLIGAATSSNFEVPKFQQYIVLPPGTLPGQNSWSAAPS